MNPESTSTSLLFHLRQTAPQDAWQRFVQLYTPLLYHWARKRLGTQEPDDLIQEVFAILVQKLPGFEYDKGKSFRAWLWTVLHNKWLDYQKRHQNANAQADSAMLAAVADNAEEFWEAD